VVCLEDCLVKLQQLQLLEVCLEVQLALVEVCLVNNSSNKTSPCLEQVGLETQLQVLLQRLDHLVKQVKQVEGDYLVPRNLQDLEHLLPVWLHLLGHLQVLEPIQASQVGEVFLDPPHLHLVLPQEVLEPQPANLADFLGPLQVNLQLLEQPTRLVLNSSNNLTKVLDYLVNKIKTNLEVLVVLVNLPLLPHQLLEQLVDLAQLRIKLEVCLGTPTRTNLQVLEVLVQLLHPSPAPVLEVLDKIQEEDFLVQIKQLQSQHLVLAAQLQLRPLLSHLEALVPPIPVVDCLAQIIKINLGVCLETPILLAPPTLGLEQHLLEVLEALAAPTLPVLEVED